MVAITHETLAFAAERDPDDPRESGRSLAALAGMGVWLMPRRALKSALRHAGAFDDVGRFAERLLESPSLPDASGACNPMFVFTKDAPSGPGLRPSFFIPLQWGRGSPDDARLPPALKKLAPGVRRVCSVEGWGLRLNREAVGDADLRRLPVSADSAWAALAAGLLLAADKGRPRGDAALSAAWDAAGKRGFLGVDGLDEKARLASEFGCRTLYVSAADHERLAAPAGLRVRPLPYAEGVGLRRLLGDFLHDMEAPPPPDAPLDERCAYANRFPQSMRNERDQFLLDRVVADRAETLGREKDAKGVGWLAVVMSSPSAAALSMLATRPERFVVLHTPEHASAAETLKTFLAVRGEPVPGKFHQIGGAEDFAGLAETVRAFLSQSAETLRKVVDVTGGIKGMTVAAALVARDCGAEIMHVGGSSGGGAHRAGEEKLVFVRTPQSSASIRADGHSKDR